MRPAASFGFASDNNVLQVLVRQVLKNVKPDAIVGKSLLALG